MSNFLADYNVFMSYVLNGIAQFWNWLSGTIIGEIMIFIIIISLFIAILYLLFGIGDD